MSFSEDDCTNSSGWPSCVQRTSDLERSLYRLPPERITPLEGLKRMRGLVGVVLNGSAVIWCRPVGNRILLANGGPPVPILSRSKCTIVTNSIPVRHNFISLKFSMNLKVRGSRNYYYANISRNMIHQIAFAQKRSCGGSDLLGLRGQFKNPAQHA
jgi:hypothetical protein